MEEFLACYMSFPGWDGTLWTAPPVVWSLILSDVVFGLTAIGISAAIFMFATAPKQEIPLPDVALLFALFTGACGVTHLLTVVTLFYPAFVGLATSQWIAVVLVLLCAVVFLRKYHTALDYHEANTVMRALIRRQLDEANTRLAAIEAEQNRAK